MAKRRNDSSFSLRNLFIVFIFGVIVLVFLLDILKNKTKYVAPAPTIPAPTITSTPSLAPIAVPIPIVIPTTAPGPVLTNKIYTTIEHYNPPLIPKVTAYTLIFIGDSMTESLGINFDDLRKDLARYYPDHIFGLFNYGFGSTNILSMEDRLNHDTLYKGMTFPAILNRDFNIIFIESSGNNPLSQYPLDQGLALQTAALDHMVAEITDRHPTSLIVFIATVAPSQELYGKGVVDLTPTVRAQWANERRAYIENHINYAKNHFIPLINVYEKTLNKNGTAMTKYLNPNDYIHPSFAGVTLISQMVADFLFKNKILLN
ncbi:MAG TPA: SGNH/GDSL hydrolase family protein [Patescibacteria group bacterium]